MGKATILTSHGAGRYDITLHEDVVAFNNRVGALTAAVAEIDSQLTTLSGEISTAYAAKTAALAALDAAIAGQEKAPIEETEKTMLTANSLYGGLLQAQAIFKARKLSAYKALETLQGTPPTERTIEAWCADYSDELTGLVGTIDVPGKEDEPVLRPGYEGQATYLPARDGLHRQREHMGPAEVFYNAAIAAGWQIWKPTYRTGIITAIEGDICSVALDPATLTQQNLNVNVKGDATTSEKGTVTPVVILEEVPIVYMNCNGAVFTVGNAVVVLLEGQKWRGAKVIGFVREPVPCNKSTFHVYADGKHWSLIRRSEGLWEKRLFPRQRVDASTVMKPWTYRDIWISSDKCHVVTNGGTYHNGRYFTAGQQLLNELTYDRVGILRYDDESQVGNPAGSTYNNEPMANRIHAVTALDSGALVAIFVAGTMVTFTSMGPDPVTTSVSLLEMLTGAFGSVGSFGLRNVEIFKFSPDGTQFVTQYHNGETITDLTNPHHVEIKNLRFEIHLAGVVSVADITINQVTLHDLGDIYQVIENITPVEEWQWYTGVLDGYTGHLYTVRSDDEKIYTSYDFGLDNALVKIERIIKTKIERLSLLGGRKTEGGLRYYSVTVKKETSSYETLLKIDGAIFFAPPIMEVTSELLDVISDNYTALYVPFTATRTYSFTGLETRNCYEICDFDARHKNFTVIQFVEDRPRGGTRTDTQTVTRTSYGETEVYMGWEGFSAPELDALVAGSTVTAATEIIILGGAEVNRETILSVGNVSVPSEQGRGRTGGLVHYNIDRTRAAVRSVVSPYGDMLVWSPVLQGLTELDASNFPRLWQADKKIFAALKDRNGSLIDFSTFGFTEIQRIGLSEGA